MFARMTKTDPQTIVAADLVIERADMRKLLAKRRRSLDDPGLEPPRDLAGQPRLALRAAADHDRVGAGGFDRRNCLLERRDVAIDDERNPDRIPHGPHRAPIGLALVELTTGAAM